LGRSSCSASWAARSAATCLASFRAPPLRSRTSSSHPGSYQGRWPHIHFEVYPSLETATDERNKIATSQIALPQDACDAVYATSGYEQSVRNMSSLSLETDNVFSDDGGVHQLGTITGDVANGYSVSLTVPVNG
jgi:hypothetical protein